MVLAWVAHDDALNGIGQLLGYTGVFGPACWRLVWRKSPPAASNGLWTRIPIVQSSSGGLPSGALLLVLTTYYQSSCNIRLAALYDYPSQISNLHPWIDVVPLVWYLVGTFLIGLLSESRGVGAIPILGYVLGLLLWHSTPGENINTLSYDIGWLGFLLLPVGISGLMLYLLFRFGRALR